MPSMLWLSERQVPPSFPGRSMLVGGLAAVWGWVALGVRVEYDNADPVETEVKPSSQEASQYESMVIPPSEETHGNVWSCWDTRAQLRGRLATHSRFPRLD